MHAQKGARSLQYNAGPHKWCLLTVKCRQAQKLYAHNNIMMQVWGQPAHANCPPLTMVAQCAGKHPMGAHSVMSQQCHDPIFFFLRDRYAGRWSDRDNLVHNCCRGNLLWGRTFLWCDLH